MRTRPRTHSLRRLQRLQPLALASVLALSANSLNAAPRTFAGPGSFWDVVANWSGGILPGVGDDALLGAFNTEVRSNFTINSFIGTGALTVSAGTLSFAAASSIGSFIQTGGVIAGTGNLTVSGTTVLGGGQMIGSGETLLNGALTMNNFAGIALDDGRVLRIAGGATLSNNSFQFNPNSTGNATAGRLVNELGSTLTDNSSSGSSFAANNFGGAENGASASFTNLGTYTKAGAGNTSIAVAFTNSGTLNVNAGTVTLSAGSTQGGNISTAAGATLNFTGGTHALNNAAGITNAGTLAVGGGTVNLGGSLNSASQMTLNGGTLNLGAGNHQTATFTQGGGVLTGTGSFTVSGAALLNGGQMIGTGDTVLNGAMSMGNFAGLNLDEGRTLRINAGATLSNNSLQLNPNSTGHATSGRIVNAAGSTLTDNSNSGSGFASNNFGGVENGASASFTNLGTYTKAGTGNSTIGVNFLNSGTLSVNGGTVTLSGGGTHTGATLTGPGLLTFQGGVHGFDAASTISTANVTFGSGSVTVAGIYNVSGTTTFNGGTVSLPAIITSLGSALVVNGGTANLGSNPISVNSLVQNGGVISGSGNLTVPVGGSVTLGGGQMIGSGDTVLNAPLAMGNFAGFNLDEGRTLRINAGATLSNNSLQLNPNSTGNATSGRIVNAAGSTLTDNSHSGSSFAANNFGGVENGASASFTNLGTYTKTGTGSTSISIPFTHSGVLNVHAGSVALSGGSTHSGTLQIAAGASLNLSSGTHALNNAAGISNAGTLLVSTGVTNVAGNLSSAALLQLNGGTLNLAGGTHQTASFSQGGGTLTGSGNFTVTGAASFSGGLMTGPGQTILDGALGMSNFAGTGLDEGRTLRLNGGATLSNNSLQLNPTSTGNASAGRIVNAAGSTLSDNSSSGSSIASNNFGGVENGASASFTNLGTYTKTNVGNTGISVSFINSGTLSVNGGIVTLSGGSTHSGAINTGATGSLSFSTGTHALDNAAAISNLGTLQVGGGTVNVAGNLNSAGLMQINGGVLNLGSGTHQTASFSQSGGFLAGTGDFTVSGTASLGSSGQMLGTGTTVLAGVLTLPNFNGFSLDEGRTLRIAGGAALSNNSFQLNPNNNGNASAGRIVNAAGSTITDNSASGSTFGANNFGGVDNGASASVTNLGTYAKTGAGNTSFNTPLVNSGVLNVNEGTVTLAAGSTHGGTLNVAAGGTLSFSAGVHALDNAAGISNAGTLQFSGGTVNLAGNLDSGALVQLSGGLLNGAGGSHRSASFSQSSGTLTGTGNFTVSGNTTLSGGQMLGTGQTVLDGALAMPNFTSFALDEARTLRIAGGATLSNNSLQLNANSSGNATAGRIVNAAGSTLTDSGSSGSNFAANNFGAADSGASASFTNLGTYAKTGSGSSTIGVNFINDGTVNAAGGALLLNRGVNGSGTLATAGTGTAVLGAHATVGALLNNGSTASALNLQTFSITVSGDYDNAGFGSGNSFNRRANVASSGSGNRLIAAGDVNQALTGALVSNGATATPTLSFGNVHVGSTTRGYQIVNVGGSGPALRGAVQTTVAGANLSDGRLSGSGVTAANWGPVAAGGTLAREVTLTVATAGVYAPVAGQAIHIVNNFDNTRSQLLTITSAAGAAAYHLAAAGNVTPNPVLLPHQRVGMALAGALTIRNTAPAGSFTEGLDASFGTLTGAALNNGGSVGLLAGGASNGSAMALGVDTGTAGSKSGTAQVLFASDGSGSSGLGLSGLPSQTVTVSGDVYRLASASAVTPAAVVFANQRVGGALTQALTLTNTAAADGFSESLNASIAASGSATAGGSFSLLAAGASNSALFVGVDTGTAGAKSGTATIHLASDGSGTSGFGALGLGTQTVAVSGNVYRLAQASSVAPGMVALGNIRQGAVATQALSLSNLAAADGFSERLNASISGSAGLLTGGSFAGLAAGGTSNSLFVGVDSSSAGARTGTATVTLASDGTGTSGLGVFGLGTQTVNVSATVFRLASASAATPNPVLLANQRVGGSLAQSLSLTNTAVPDSFSERLAATIAAGGAATAGGSFSGLLAGGTSAALFVGVDTNSAGAKSGTATITLASDGSGTSGLGSVVLGTQNIAVSGSVYRLASASAVSPGAVLLADQRVGGTLTQALNLSNTAAADGFSERLNAGISAGGSAVASGSLSLLAAGASSNALQVGVDTGSAGAKSGIATLALASDGTGTSGFGALALAAQNVNVIGNVYRLAVPLVDATPLTLVGRVGDTLAAAQIAVTNNAPDLFTERLDASIAGAPAGLSGGPALTGLAPNASGNLALSLSTAAAGSFSGMATVGLVSSSAGTSSGAPDFALPSASVAVNARVYAPAVAQVAPTVVNFGTVRVGDTVAARTVSVGNAASGALTDTLSASFSGGGTAFTAGGNAAAIAAGGNSGSALQVALATASAGVFSGNASLAFSSQNPDLADLTLAPVNVALMAQVNHLAQVSLAQAGGTGIFSSAGPFSYLLDFGTLVSGSGNFTVTLALGNGASGPADALAGSWDLTLPGGAGAFTLGGFGSFAGLAAGSTLAGLSVSFDTTGEGVFGRTLLLQAISTNGSGPDLALMPIDLRLQGTVVAVPEPSTYLMMAVGVLAMGSMARRRLRAQRD